MTTVVYVFAQHDDASAHGVVFVHSCPRALTPHLEWALERVLDAPAAMEWSQQPVEPGTVRAELVWNARPGTGALLTSALLAIPGMRFEVTEDWVPGREGERFSVTPALGVFRSSIGPHGDVLVSEERLRATLRQSKGQTKDALVAELGRILGEPWDDELEVFRACQPDSTVRVLHNVV